MIGISELVVHGQTHDGGVFAAGDAHVFNDGGAVIIVNNFQCREAGYDAALLSGTITETVGIKILTYIIDSSRSSANRLNAHLY